MELLELMWAVDGKQKYYLEWPKPVESYHTWYLSKTFKMVNFVLHFSGACLVNESMIGY